MNWLTDKKNIVLFVVLTLLGALYIHPLYDIDFWWHLKTGEWIWTNKAIPGSDPFSFSTYVGDYAPHQGRISYILSQYWLSQPFFYLSWFFFGPNGVLALRVLVLLGAVAVVHGFLVNKRITPVVAGSLALIAGLHMTFFSAEKPQLFSFLFSVLYLYEIEYAFEGRKRPLFSLPLLTLAWANMHSSALMAWFIGGLYLVEGIFTIVKQPEKKDTLKFPLAVIGLSLLMTFLNPNTLHVFDLVPKTEFTTATALNNEYISPLIKLKEGFLYPSYWLLLLLSLAFIFNKEARFSRKILLLFLLVLSLKSIRYTPFFVLLCPMLLADDLKNILGRIPKYVLVLSATACILAVFTFYEFRADLGRTGINEEDYPRGAVQFVRNNRITGNVFNFFEWGGYLEWHLPSSKTFIDSRVLRHDIFANYAELIHASSPQQIAALETYAPDFVMLPTVSPATGEPLHIIDFLIRHSGWKAVYCDTMSVVFVRRDFPLQEIPAHAVYDQRIMLLRKWLQRDPENDVRWKWLGNAYFMMNDRENALSSYQNALRLRPSDTYTANLIKMLSYKQSK